MGERPLATLLKDKLTEEELALVPRSYDVIGSREKSVAIIEIPEGLENKKQLIAEAVLKLNKKVKSVLNKLSGRKGPYRTEDLELLAGDENTEVIHKEHYYMVKLDPQKIFFSPRELTERQRIAGQVKVDEIVLVMFSGCMPYGLAIAKKQPLVKKIYGVEINPDAHEYGVENIRINKLSHKIISINDDVRIACPRLGKFDRIIMPYAVGAYQFLDVAFSCVKDKGIVHFYHIGPESDLFTEAESLAKATASHTNKKIKIIKRVKTLPFGTRYWKICLDIEVSG